jgi:DNA-binding response OmpR family regulator
MRRILLIDDDDELRSALRRTLERAGYEVVAAADGEAGMRALADTTVDLVLTDIFMPNMEGIETIRALRRHHPEVPIIAMSGGTGFRAEDYLDVASSFGAIAVLAKPFESRELLAAIAKALA